jgi:two-component system chemotaxis response regulator CheB
MAKIRVLLVDDSVLVRKLLAEALSADPRFEVVGTAPNGRIALDKLDQLAPDAIVLDVEMPDLDGLETLRAIRARSADLPVIMFSALTERCATATLDALSLGASDYVPKPTSSGGMFVSRAQAVASLTTKLEVLCRGAHPTRPPAALPAGPAAAPAVSARCRRPELVVLGASTGGPNAVAELVGLLPPQLPVPIVIVQHMPPLFTRMFAERLSTSTGFESREAATGEKVAAGQIRIAPGDFHVALARPAATLQVVLHQGPPENSCRPAVDVLFASAADLCGSGVLGVVLTGMGFDGLRGAELIRGAGGTVFVQDEASSVVWSMPGSIARAGHANKVLCIADLATEIARWAHG